MKKKEIKIVGLDLDGTLLTDKKELLPYTKNVIGEALQNGTVVLVATGRPWTGVPEELRELPGMDYAEKMIAAAKRRKVTKRSFRISLITA